MNGSQSARVNAMQDQVAQKLDEIAQLFTRPGDCRLTIVIRTPWLDDGGVMLTNESDVEEAVLELRRQMSRETEEDSA